ncbi:hypothetical protein HDU98_009100 [Podochytrium sp. JEL0797]|nr:hypothetical protein HDU98_009100 [Podochytrium sp. JEL0797]
MEAECVGAGELEPERDEEEAIMALVLEINAEADDVERVVKLEMTPARNEETGMGELVELVAKTAAGKADECCAKLAACGMELETLRSAETDVNLELDKDEA